MVWDTSGRSGRDHGSHLPYPGPVSTVATPNMALPPSPGEIRPRPVPLPPRPSRAAVVRAYVALTKPRIIELLLITTVPAMMLAAGGLPRLDLVAVVLVGGALAAGSANALNCYLDRDIDVVMRRTSRRPLPTHAVAPRDALRFGLILGVVAVALMAAFTNLLATALTAGAIVYYDLVYTRWLKRRTPLNTVAGGACGAAPVLIGWAAVTGSLAAPAWLLFGVVFLWQVPHFYALAMKFRDDYARAGVPMLPVVAGVRRVTTEIVVYAWLTAAVSLAVWPLATTPVYGLVALAAGASFVVEAHRLHRSGGRRPIRLFHWSNSYLAIVFLAVAVDALIG